MPVRQRTHADCSPGEARRSATPPVPVVTVGRAEKEPHGLECAVGMDGEEFMRGPGPVPPGRGPFCTTGTASGSPSDRNRTPRRSDKVRRGRTRACSFRTGCAASSATDCSRMLFHAFPADFVGGDRPTGGVLDGRRISGVDVGTTLSPQTDRLRRDADLQCQFSSTANYSDRLFDGFHPEIIQFFLSFGKAE